jgi:hypothetical protein
VTPADAADAVRVAREAWATLPPDTLRAMGMTAEERNAWGLWSEVDVLPGDRVLIRFARMGQLIAPGTAVWTWPVVVRRGPRGWVIESIGAAVTADPVVTGKIVVSPELIH